VGVRFNLNDAHWKDAEFDRLIAESNAQDGAKRAATLAKAEALLLGGAAVLPIYHSLAVNVVDTDIVEGWYSNALDMHPFKYMRVGSPKALPNLVLAD